jgi:hypothetical protein
MLLAILASHNAIVPYGWPPDCYYTRQLPLLPLDVRGTPNQLNIYVHLHRVVILCIHA